MSSLFVLAPPILPDKMDHWLAMVRELNGPRKADYAASRKRLGVRERAFLLKTPMGDMS